jgi:hypothetical protein
MPLRPLGRTMTAPEGVVCSHLYYAVNVDDLEDLLVEGF